MTSELSFLLDLLLNQRMPLVTKELVVARIKEVELTLGQSPSRQPVAMNITGFLPPNPTGSPQAASTLAALARHQAPEAPVAVVAQTPAAAAAMNSRNIAIAESIAGKVDKVTGRPRKF